MSYALMKAGFATKCDHGAEKMVLLTLCWFAGQNRAVAASNAVIANAACCNEKTVSKWLASLERKGHISSRRQGRGRRFTVHLPLVPDFPVIDAEGQIACSYCDGVGLAMEIDHIVPRSRGGSNDNGNLTVACIGCNSEKGDQLLEEWRA